MSEDMERPPWWMSDANDSGGPGGPDESGERGSSGQAPGLGDMWSLLGMLGSTGNLGSLGNLGSFGNLGSLANLGSVAGEWWEASGASTHTEHENPGEHPDCLICKVLVGLQSVSQPGSGPVKLPPAQWLGVRRA